MNDAALTAELDTDPVGMGYAAAGWSANPPTAPQYQAIADLINGKTRSRDRTEVPGYEVFSAIRPADFLTVFDAAGNVAHQSYMTTLFTLDSVPLDNSGVRSALTTVFTGKTATLNAIAALQTEAISRVRELDMHAVRVGDLKRLKGDV